MNSQPIMLRIISSAVCIISKAGSEVRRIAASGQLATVDKGGQNNYQTEADRYAQRIIVASLAHKFPKCTIIGEEDESSTEGDDKDLVVDSVDEEVLKFELPKEYENKKEEDITIWIDPLDGTSEFVKGLKEPITVLIGISIDGKSVAGIIHQPFYESPNQTSQGRTVWGLLGLGCFGISPKPARKDKLIIATTSSHGNETINCCIDALTPDHILRVGGAGYKVLLVIEGRASSYVFASNGCKKWDTCAPEAVLKSLGGQLTDLFGCQLEYQRAQGNDYRNKTGVIATMDKELHCSIVNKIPNSIKAKF